MRVMVEDGRLFKNFLNYNCLYHNFTIYLNKKVRTVYKIFKVLSVPYNLQRWNISIIKTFNKFTIKIQTEF